MKQLSIMLAISTILGLLGLLLVTSPDITVSFIDSLKPICNALNIQTRAEAQSYILMFTLVSFVGCFITMILAFKGKQLRRRRERRVRQAREMRNLGSIVVNTKEDLKEIAKEEQKKEEEVVATENVETPKKEKKSFADRFKRKKKEINDTIDEKVETTEAVKEEVVEEVVQTVEKTVQNAESKVEQKQKTHQQQFDEWLSAMRKK